MRALILLAPILIVLLGTFLAGRQIGQQLARRDWHELQLRRSADAHLRADALDRMDVDPYARVVYDTLNNTEREISQ